MKRLPALLLSLLSTSSLGAQVGPPVDYETDVQPILSRSCATPGCHAQPNSGVRLTSHEAVLASVGLQYGQAVVVPGDAAASPLFDKISRASPRFGSRMPFGRPPLSDADIDTIRRWIDEGALPVPRRPVDYDTEVQPILSRSCAIPGCHAQPNSGVQLTSHEAVLASVGLQYGQAIVVPGDAAASPLFDKISEASPAFGNRMPFGAPPLPDADIDTIRRWIDEGAAPTLVVSRGDFDGNEAVNISDAVLLLNFLFVGGKPPTCEAIADTNSDGTINLSDAVFLLSFLFVSGPAPEPIVGPEREGCR